MFTDEILSLVYEIQGAADPSHPDFNIKERMREIWEKACFIMDKTGWQPEYEFADDGPEEEDES